MLRRAARALGRPGARYGDRVRQCHDAPALSQPTSAVISDADKYFFDTNGVLILRQVLSKQMIAAMNAAIDTRMVDDTIERR